MSASTLLHRAAVTLLVLAAAPAAATAAPDRVPVMESLPFHLQMRLNAQRRDILPASAAGGALFGIIDQEKAWEPGTTLHVCFFGGSPQIRSRIAKVAAEWVRPGNNVNLKLDFGDMEAPQFCTPERFFHIRVGFFSPGHWSLVGIDSINLASQLEPSLNLFMFDFVPPQDEAEFRFLVLHEFGHALGRQHEHQQPGEGCAEEFDWDALQRYLAGPPNYWGPERIEANMQALDADGRYLATAFDRDSVMLYRLDAWMYKTGENSRCFIDTYNAELSPGDVALMQAAYAQTPAARSAERQANLERVITAIQATEMPTLGKQFSLQALTAATTDTSHLFGQGMFAVVPAWNQLPGLATNPLLLPNVQHLAVQPRTPPG